MHTTVQPPMAAWRPAAQHTPLVLATGHQAWLWHPGILAKYLALQHAVNAHQAHALNLIVDHDAHAALRLDIPVRDGDRLGVTSLQLAEENPQIPTACRAPADIASVQRVLREAALHIGDRAEVIADAFADTGDSATLGEQMARVLEVLMRPYLGAIQRRMSTQLTADDAFQAMIEAMVRDSGACMDQYNRAVGAHPQAGMTAMQTEADRVEIPLWSLQWGKPRLRVFVMQRGGRTNLVDELGDAVDFTRSTMAPRALLLTAYFRSTLCDLFIHGKGGQVYDAITEQWWRTWRGQELAPMATVSADVYMDFAAPVAEREDVARAAWRVHHLPHNLDRALPIDGQRVRRKRELLAHMDDDRDRARRRAAFDEIHRINAAMVEEHRNALDQADAELRRIRIGLANRAIARKRDWCFALYPPAAIVALRDALKPASKGT